MKLKAAETTLAGAEDDLNKVRKGRAKEMENITMQFSMLAYASLDIFAEKAQTTPDYEVYMRKKKEKAGAPPESQEEEQTYLGLLMQTFVDRYEVDIYGYISITNMKYLVFKIESKLNPVSVNPTDRHMRKIFEKLLNYHTEMLLNPFFDFDQMNSSKCY